MHAATPWVTELAGSEHSVCVVNGMGHIVFVATLMTRDL